VRNALQAAHGRLGCCGGPLGSPANGRRCRPTENVLGPLVEMRDHHVETHLVALASLRRVFWPLRARSKIVRKANPESIVKPLEPGLGVRIIRIKIGMPPHGLLAEGGS
jgi:hypothetical protein